MSLFLIFQNLLNKKSAKTIVTDRNTSESTSGCESGQEIDESDELDNLSAKSSSQREPSSEEDSGHVRSSPSNYVMQISMGLPPDAQFVQSPPEGGMYGLLINSNNIFKTENYFFKQLYFIFRYSFWKTASSISNKFSLFFSWFERLASDAKQCCWLH